MRAYSIFPRLAVIAAIVVNATGCLDTDLPSPGPVQATLIIQTVPADVSCLRITATGPGRALVREISVRSGNTLTENLSGLPLGQVVFTGEAFPADCGAVTKATLPGWVSEPVTVSIILSRIATVNLTLSRNGRAKVGIDFTDDPACSPVAEICRLSNECCSHQCDRGVCVAPTPDGGVPPTANDAAPSAG